MSLFEWWNSLSRRRPVRTASVRDDWAAAYTPGTGRPDVFDPSLKHRRKGFRMGDPDLPRDLRAAWLDVHEQAVLYVAAAIAGVRLVLAGDEASARNPLGEHLVLRGGLALRLWFGDRARPPRDLDFVVVPTTWGAGTAEARALLDGIVAAVTSAAPHPAVAIQADAVALDEIWTYDRVEGRRLTFRYTPTRADLQPYWGDVQVDVVFTEPMADPAGSIAVGGHSLAVASRRESLAWKLFWLWSDMHPQGKDLYDAMLLAEEAPAGSLVGLGRLLVTAASVPGHGYVLPAEHRDERTLLGRILADLPRSDLGCEWGTFAAEYPMFAEPGAAALLDRLVAALGRAGAT